MIKATIVKGIHAGVVNAKKLIPYIQSCDVYSPECAGYTEHQAQVAEDHWLSTLAQNPNLTEFRRRLSVVAGIGERALELTLNGLVVLTQRNQIGSQ
ncbi:hypothetical protein HY641_02980 [Candidatus Woesearchaeota archaeon]|nr:hypothetical protein [Candidatus Woesearchaeota archaeon]